MRLSWRRRRTAQPTSPRPNQWRGPRAADEAAKRPTVDPTRLRRLGRLVVWAGLLLLGGWLALVASRELLPLMKRWFAIQQITVEGLRHVTKQEVLTRLNLKPDAALYQVNGSYLAERLRAHPWIKEASFERVPLHELRVTIVERVPAAVVRTGSEHLLTDDEGTVLARMGSQDDPLLPLLSGVEARGLVQGDRRAREAVSAAVQLAKLMAQTYDGRPEIDAGNPSNLVASLRGVWFQFGEDGLAEQWDRFGKVRPSIKALAVEGNGRGLQEVDLRYDNRVIVRERG